MNYSMMTTPRKLNPLYGLLWWLNANKKWYPNASETMFAASGTGKWVFVDKENDLVIVLRRVDSKAVNGFWEKVIGSL